MPRDADLAWAAGFIDGEGCVAVDSRKSPRITVSNTDRRPLDRLQELLGGTICVHGRGNPEKGHRPSWVWAVHGGRSVRRVLAEVRPYLVVKGEQADLVLAAAPGSTSLKQALVEARRAA